MRAGGGGAHKDEAAVRKKKSARTVAARMTHRALSLPIKKYRKLQV